MRKSIWIFLFAVLLPGAVLGWLALHSAEEQQIVFEKRTAELYQKETETLAATVRETVESERRGFGDVVHRLLAKGDANALARDFTNTLADAWPRKAVGFVLGADGRMLSPANHNAAASPEHRRFLVANSSFLTGTEASQVYFVAPEILQKGVAFQSRSKTTNVGQNYAQNANEAITGGTLELSKITAPVVAKDGNSMRLNGKVQGSADGLKSTQNVEADDARIREQKLNPQISGDRRLDTTEKPKASDISDPPAPPAKGPSSDKPIAAAASQPMPSLAPAPAPARAAVAKKMDSDISATTAAPASAVKSKFSIAENTQIPGELRKLADEKTKAERTQESKAAAEPQPATPITEEQSTAGNLLFNRQVEPQQQAPMSTATNWSSVKPATADFRALTQGSEEGMVSRFVEDRLDLIFWLRPPEAPEMVFGCLIEAAELHPLWPSIFEEQTASGRGSESSRPPFILALLDDKARPVATQAAGAENRDWKHPFVASEIGEVLPHWEATLYLASPSAIADTARGLRRLISFAIFGAVALIALGGWLVVADARRQLALAQQKTDFVSNVSHELKTPLTSIRMFAELMHDRPQPAEKQGQYLRIITVEAERLTRLINNVLDFAKSERKQRRFEKKTFDLHETISRVWEGQEIHLRSVGFATRWDATPPPYRFSGDEDAIAQVLVNLLSNAEKYSTERKEIELRTWLEKDAICVSVSDRGIGVPAGEERKIFDAFYRAHDSLSSGIQGSGLGLTLAQRVATEHGGTISAERREGGGSRFTLRLPLMTENVKTA